MLNNLMNLLNGVPVSLFVMVLALLIAFFMAVMLTLILTLKIPILSQLTHVFTTLFTGTPLLIQIFLIYYGPGQFTFIQTDYPALWQILSEPIFCAILALALNSAAYTTVLFKGMVDAIPATQWQACYALGMSKKQAIRIIFPYAMKRAVAAYSNEVILIFKATSLVSTITIMDIMGYAQQIYGFTYDFSIYALAGAIYLLINGFFTIVMRKTERKMLAFETR